MGTSAAVNEKREARALMPEVAWPTVVFGVAVTSFHWLMVWAALTGRVPLWSVTLPLGWTAYAHYTLVHESVHGNIVRNNRHKGLIHAAVGWYASLFLFGNWPLLSRTHKAHHSHTNTDMDPDIFTKGTWWQMTWGYITRRIVILLFPMILVRMVVRDRSHSKGYVNASEIMTRSEKIQHFTVDALLSMLVWVGVFAGFGAEVFALYVVPAGVGGYLLTLLFQWLPHHPFRGTGRYDATRNSGVDAANGFMLFQNWHLMHHLWPGVPWYNYRKLHRAIRPALEARGARHEDGLWIRRESGAKAAA